MASGYLLLYKISKLKYNIIIILLTRNAAFYILLFVLENVYTMHIVSLEKNISSGLICFAILLKQMVNILWSLHLSFLQLH